MRAAIWKPAGPIRNGFNPSPKETPVRTSAITKLPNQVLPADASIHRIAIENYWSGQQGIVILPP